MTTLPRPPPPAQKDIENGHTHLVTPYVEHEDAAKNQKALSVPKLPPIKTSGHSAITVPQVNYEFDENFENSAQEMQKEAPTVNGAQPKKATPRVTHPLKSLRAPNPKTHHSAVMDEQYAVLQPVVVTGEWPRGKASSATNQNGHSAHAQSPKKLTPGNKKSSSKLTVKFPPPPTKPRPTSSALKHTAQSSPSQQTAEPQNHYEFDDGSCICPPSPGSNYFSRPQSNYEFSEQASPSRLPVRDSQGSEQHYEFDDSVAAGSISYQESTENMYATPNSRSRFQVWCGSNVSY